jgi:predicted RNase H-like nuclease (RuvC/YqgF family)
MACRANKPELCASDLEVEKVSPDLVTREEEGKPATVRYEAVNAMLLNEFLKEHRKVEEEATTIAELKASAMRQQKQIEALAATVQKVSEEMGPSETTAQLVADRH